jgi:hypothetical protein
LNGISVAREVLVTARRRHLLELCRSGELVRVGLGEYEAAPPRPAG